MAENTAGKTEGTKDPLEGKSLPAGSFEATQVGQVRFPDDLQGKWTILYFYPKDDTPGCTKQACGYRDRVEDFRKLGVQIFGVSGDDVDSHEKFKEKFSLNFPLIADTDHVLGETLGTWHVTVNQDKSFWGNSRDSFLVGPDGRIRQVWRKVSSSETMGETYEAAKRWCRDEQSRRTG